ncbi:hypothetical protein [Micromonospora aurantiaca (nom. illeg.)]|uniref:hypothetical protein n=1 Tax=Micromonospora aurantiaca (nom. illeg.) TaxID=47850 RepID=UPI00114CD611|nr:hypothetical protein [Micromonospora aurantiaca]
MQLEVSPASGELETRPDVIGYTSVLLAREEHRLFALLDPDDPDGAGRAHFEAAVRRYLGQLESAVYDRTDRLLGLRKIAPLSVSVRNDDGALIQGAQVTIRLHAHGQQQLIQADLDEDLLTEIPIPPSPPGGVAASPLHKRAAAWTPGERTAPHPDPFDRAADSVHRGLRNVVEPALIIATPKDERLIELVYPEVDLRPGQILLLPDVALDLLEPVNEWCEATWTVTARNHPGIVTGRFELFTVADPYALARTWPAANVSPAHGSRARAGSDYPPGSGAREPICGILDDVNPLLLAAGGELPSTKLRQRLWNAVREIGALHDEALDDDPQAAVDRLVAKYRVPDTAYRGDPTVAAPVRQRREQVRDFPHPTRMVNRVVQDYEVAVDFDGDAGLVRASLATCAHEPQWQVRGSQIRAVFTADVTMPGSKLERWIRERAADAAAHLDNARRDLARYHDELNAAVEDLVPKMLAVRLAGQRQREELTLTFASASINERDGEPSVGADAARTPPGPSTDPEMLFEEVLKTLESSAEVLAAHTPLVQALDTEELLRFHLILFLQGRHPEPYLFTAETFHGQGKVDIAVHWNGRLIGVVECKVWHSERQFREGIDQVLSYLTPNDTRVAYVVFIKQQTVTSIVDVLKHTMLNHANCADTESPTGSRRFTFAFHATADPGRPITMDLLPMPLATSATGKSTDRGLRRRPPPGGQGRGETS